MNSAARKIDHHENAMPAPIDVFRERCEARAALVVNGYLDLQTAVDQLQEAAAAQWLVATHGQDRVQEIMSEAFARWR
jgi:NADH:ubiquinone oxidoreductase subunit B-like Fe-S oxidoreductase